jgi:hypothetical protein
MNDRCQECVLQLVQVSDPSVRLAIRADRGVELAYGAHARPASALERPRCIVTTTETTLREGDGDLGRQMLHRGRKGSGTRATPKRFGRGTPSTMCTRYSVLAVIYAAVCVALSACGGTAVTHSASNIAPASVPSPSASSTPSQSSASSGLRSMGGVYCSSS